MPIPLSYLPLNGIQFIDTGRQWIEAAGSCDERERLSEATRALARELLRSYRHIPEIHAEASSLLTDIDMAMERGLAHYKALAEGTTVGQRLAHMIECGRAKIGKVIQDKVRDRWQYSNLYSPFRRCHEITGEVANGFGLNDLYCGAICIEGLRCIASAEVMRRLRAKERVSLSLNPTTIDYGVTQPLNSPFSTSIRLHEAGNTSVEIHASGTEKEVSPTAFGAEVEVSILPAATISWWSVRAELEQRRDDDSSSLQIPQASPTANSTPWTMASMEDRVFAFLLAAYDASGASEKQVWCNDVVRAFEEDKWAAIDILASLEDRGLLKMKSESIDTTKILNQRERLEALKPEASKRLQQIKYAKLHL